MDMSYYYYSIASSNKVTPNMYVFVKELQRGAIFKNRPVLNIDHAPHMI